MRPGPFAPASEAPIAVRTAHVESVRRHFVDLLTPEQIEGFAEIGETPVAHLTDRKGPGAGRAAQPDGRR
ncbi:hypothetical protein [Streptomyces sp. NRRL S-1521]|uniref:hypothetical protein n=1 Tax=Streptomyces sp. NRRL S-1521 TaxID=1609100 RepID=UPI000A76D682|nr:hypothetical protein [Streptomyces sp. NRRL S-1521]